MTYIDEYTSVLDKLNFADLYGGDFFLTWEKSYDEIVAVFTVADALRRLRENNASTRIFDSGLAVSLFRNSSIRTRFSFSSACNLLGLTVQDLDEGSKSQTKSARETANMVSFMADVIGIRDNSHIGKGNAYMREIAETLNEGYLDGQFEQCPTVLNLQCEIDHPTQTMADMNHLIRHFGGIDELKGKKIAMAWAYAPTGKPLSVPQGIIALMTRFGMDVHLAHPKGYDLMPQIETIAKENAATSGGTFVKSNSIQEAFADADIVYSRTWSPYTAMEQRTHLFDAEIKGWEKELLAQNAEHKDWECTDTLMKTTKDSNALYLHSPHAIISGISGNKGEVAAPVFERYRIPLYKQAGHKPYITAAMIVLAKIKHPQEVLTEIVSQNHKRHL